MIRKRIGVLLAQTDEPTPDLFMQGFLDKAFALNYDVVLFSSYQKYQETPLREHGDNNIFELFTPKHFDAIVILLDTLQAKGLANHLQKRIKKNFDGPVLVVDKESKYFPAVMMDHYTPIVKLVDHLIEHHGYKDIVFLNGKKGHIHSEQRLQGYIDSMKAHGLPVTEDKIFYGDYWYTSGDPMVEELLQHPEQLPDAIACANDCMAIGVCTALTKNGIRIPEDIAITGYDSIMDGHLSPIPITSADIPAKECGTYCARWIDAALNNQTIEEFRANVDLYVGGTCGCQYGPAEMECVRRTEWPTDLSSERFHSVFNHIMDDLLTQDNYQDFFNIVFQYTYQIRDFDSFHLLLNDTWDQPQNMVGDNALRNGYTKKMRHIIRCGKDETTGNALDFDATFDTSMLLPELFEEHDTPKAYIFTPLYFNDRSFGYAVISYGDTPKVYNEDYRLWLRSVMQGIEALQQKEYLRFTLKQVEAAQIRDGLTGLYNYRGFLNQAVQLSSHFEHQDKVILITAIDLNALKDINAQYGREEGNRAIKVLSHCIQECTKSGEICARMGNDDFIVCSFVKPDNLDRSEAFIEELNHRLEQFNERNRDSFQISICYDKKNALVSEMNSFEKLINDTISLKNGKKLEEQKRRALSANLSEADKQQDALVTDILNNNKFTYHFQPIVNAHTGEIYSYEALMRADIPERISPLSLLDSAKRMNRLYDVEKSTFFNVLTYMEEHPEQFEGKKVFINSIPGNQIEGEDTVRLHELLGKQDGKIVVELTEQEELDDEHLIHIKETFKRLHIETALDDYGSGYSNINNLLRYMPKYVKIDRMLMTEIHNNPQKQHFVKDIIEFAHDNDIWALAEGIETPQELKEVIRLGADLIQGYYTAKPSPVPIASIDQRLRNEIVQYNLTISKKIKKKRFVVDEPMSIPLVQLAVNKYTEIHVKREASSNQIIDLIGAAGFQSGVKIWFEEGFEGVLRLNNASLGTEKGMPCIDLADEVKLTIILEGENELHNGGIRVPETSILTVEGEGNLSIDVNMNKHYGIGNDIESFHGPLYFNQDGGISIKTNGMRGVGIGSGKGGEITINKGWYRIDISSQEAVGVGALIGPTNVFIQHCDFQVHMGAGTGCLLGSYLSNATIGIENGLVKFSSSNACTDIIGIGTLKGEACQIDLHKLNISFDLHCISCYAMGGHYSDTEILINQASTKIIAIGKNTYAMGNDDSTARITVMNVDLETDVTNNDSTDIKADEEYLQFVSGSTERKVNNQTIEQEILGLTH